VENINKIPINSQDTNGDEKLDSARKYSTPHYYKKSQITNRKL